MRGLRINHSRLAAQSSRRLPCQLQQRYASSASHGHGEHGEHGHGHPAPVNEPLGKSFYFTIAAVPLSYLLYVLSRGAQEDGKTGQQTKPLFTRVIDSYSDYKERWVTRNTLHTNMMEQAAFDRNLFQSAPKSKAVDLRFPEVFNTGSPYNVPAGNGGGNIDELIAHYEKKNYEDNERKLRALQEGKVVPRN
ncbi:hypothetical protein L228DRAFT_246645 [Xylona heveae TC161]|uniref:NADH-ubiquinone oxidoreductase 17.8 kDa subunit n=1 Tax=Xylona heveae (strain CBS 132557 / TC161) TaxID=1328760 RepID=A0A165HP97_XYLHT|nr:hypothetical protein L228DRAFT_246645 [Xylona heveae TC161]KZF23798.1 hypothetical protein L228DRAFT_246645 [Xylona heveae TC161]